MLSRALSDDHDESEPNALWGRDWYFVHEVRFDAFEGAQR